MGLDIINISGIITHPEIQILVPPYMGNIETPGYFASKD